MILTRLQSVEQRLRLLDMQGSASVALGCIEAIQSGAPEALYVNWTDQLEAWADGRRAERDAMYLASHGAML